MELLQLKYFKKVAETGKISTAAAALYISSPALSATISRLEKELGMRLFDRHSNRIVLNKQGEIFLRYVNQVFTSLECAKTELSQSLLQGGQQVQIAVSSPEVWREMLSFFTVAHPEIRLVTTTLSISQLSSVNLSGQYTFLLAAEGDLPDGDWEQLLLFEDQLLLMIHEDNLLAQKERVELRDLEGQRIFLPPRDSAFNRRLREILQDAGLSRESFDECADGVRRVMVQDNRGVSFCTRFTDPDGEPGVNYVPIYRDRSRLRQKIYWDRSRHLRPEEQTLLTFMQDFYRNHKHAAR